MPQGLQVFDAAGALRVDVTHRLTKLMGSQAISAPGSLTLTALQGNALFACFVPNSGAFGVHCQPVVTISGATISWSYAGSINRAAGTLFYGQY